jgi:hypothetical protein
MIVDPSKNLKQKIRFNEGETYVQKRTKINSFHSPVLGSGLK